MTQRDLVSQSIGRLNPKQREAVMLGADSTLVLAGAGSGKTSVLTTRIAYLISKGVKPEAIIAVTFTNKAASEMRQRLRKILNDDCDQMWIGTFHSLCNRILRENFEEAGIPKNFGILDEDGQEIILRTILKDMGIKPNADGIPPGAIRGWINKQKEFGILPGQSENLEGQDNYDEIYRAYESICTKQGLLDFNDLLSKAVKLLEINSMVRETYRMRFRAMLVDEFQDTNDIQYKWLDLLRNPEKMFVMAVGDDDQSIYGFRGANPRNMQRFIKEIACNNVIRLEQNYRSLPHILAAANGVIANNTDRIGKELWTDADPGQAGKKILCTEFSNGFFEANRIAARIKELISNGTKRSEIAVLYRTNMQSRIIEQEMIKAGIPLIVYGGFKFYDRQEIKRVINYLDLVFNIERDLSFTHVVNFPPRDIGERTVEDLRQEAKQKGVCMMEAISIRGESEMKDGSARRRQASLESFASLVIGFVEMAQSCSLPDLIKEVVRSTGMLEHYQKDKADEERIGNIEELVSAATQFEAEHPEFSSAGEMLPEYLSFVQLMSSTSEADMSKKDTVSLMTVHSAKGLEFDNVFVCGLEEGVFPHERSINGGDIDQIEEERRLMYVAITRARKNLEITLAKKRMIFGEEKCMQASRFLDEIPDHVLARKKDAAPLSLGNHASFKPLSTLSGLRLEQKGMRP